MRTALGDFSHSDAIVAVMVRRGRRMESKRVGITGAFPVTIITAMVSPNALPTPNITAVSTPDLAAGKVTPQMVCHLVAPSANAACR